MANVNNTLLRTQSKPEKIASWLFNTSSNWRNVLGFLLIALLTLISIRFNYELGKLSAVDETSKKLLPAGYAMLDLCCLFLSGYVGIRSQSIFKKCVAWFWFTTLLSLSLWAAASFTLSVDSRIANRSLESAIAQKKIEVESLNADVNIWRKNVEESVNFKTKHQITLRDVQARQSKAAQELLRLEDQLVPPTMAIYERAAPSLNVTPEKLELIVRLLWAAALTLSPLVIVLLVATETHNTNGTQPSENSRTKNRFKHFFARTRTHSSLHEGTQKIAVMPTSSAFAENFAYPQESLKGNNTHTEALELRAFELAKKWLAEKESGRVSRAEIRKVCQLYTRDGITKVINALLHKKLLVKLKNGQYIKPDKPSLHVVKH